MQIRVRAFGRLRELLPAESRAGASLAMMDGSTLEQLLAALGLADQAKVVIVNGTRTSDWERTLYDGDQVHLFPLAGGG